VCVCSLPTRTRSETCFFGSGLQTDVDVDVIQAAVETAKNLFLLPDRKRMLSRLAQHGKGKYLGILMNTVRVVVGSGSAWLRTGRLCTLSARGTATRASHQLSAN
jgi:hypothetical protein